jgi:hypothetical protein
MKPCRHEGAAEGCRLCHLYETRPDYRALWDGPPPGPCAHRGPRVRVAGSARDWHRCDRPDRHALGLADVVCPCAGCNSKCPGYEAET